MMYNYPFSGFPFFRKYRYGYYNMNPEYRRTDISNKDETNYLVNSQNNSKYNYHNRRNYTNKEHMYNNNVVVDPNHIYPRNSNIHYKEGNQNSNSNMHNSKKQNYTREENTKKEQKNKKSSHNVTSSNRGSNPFSNIFNNLTKGTSNEEPIFEIFGISVCFDDLLIIAMLFFLYTEDVEDQSLFISLILLLLS